MGGRAVVGFERLGELGKNEFNTVEKIGTPIAPDSKMPMTDELSATRHLDRGCFAVQTELLHARRGECVQSPKSPSKKLRLHCIQSD